MTAAAQLWWRRHAALVRRAHVAGRRALGRWHNRARMHEMYYTAQISFLPCPYCINQAASCDLDDDGRSREVRQHKYSAVTHIRMYVRSSCVVLACWMTSTLSFSHPHASEPASLGCCSAHSARSPLVSVHYIYSWNQILSWGQLLL